MSLLDETKYLVKKYKIAPDNDRGQHFLIDESALATIVDAGELRSSETVLEIGAGLGTLTTALAKKVGHVLAVESDRRLREPLQKICDANKKIDIIFDDFFHVSFDDLIGHDDRFRTGAYKVVANIPYYVTGKIIKCILAYPVLPATVVLLVQKEVAEQLVAGPGSYTKQSLSVQLHGIPEIVGYVPSSSFWPEPEVDSAVIRISSMHGWEYAESEERLWQLARIAFSSKRKKIVNNLAAGLQLTKEEVVIRLKKADISPDVRAQDLSIDTWRKLVTAFPEE